MINIKHKLVFVKLKRKKDDLFLIDVLGLRLLKLIDEDEKVDEVDGE